MSGLIGQSLGRYHVLEQRGAPQGCCAKGGMAIVYKAYNTRLKRNVAVMQPPLVV